jgi:hypothetical protein
MRVDNDYTSYQNRNYGENHKRHLTEYPQEDEEKKTEGSKEALKHTETRTNQASYSRDGDSYRTAAALTPAVQKTEKKSKGLIKGLWDALGEDDSEAEQSLFASLRDMVRYQIAGKIQGLPARVLQRFTDGIRAVMKSLGTALGKGGSAFGALTGGMTGEDAQAKEEKTNEEMSDGEKEEEISGKMLKHSHLTDSYNNRGEYSRLGENLTYQSRK